MVAAKNKHLKWAPAIGENHRIFSRVNASKKDESSDNIISNDEFEANAMLDFAKKGIKVNCPHTPNTVRLWNLREIFIKRSKRQHRLWWLYSTLVQE